MKAVVSTVFDCEGMKSKKHVALHEILGKPMMDYAIKAARDAGLEVIVVENAEDVKNLIERDSREPESYLLIAGNAPLITGDTLKKLIKFHAEHQNHISMVSCDSLHDINTDGNGKVFDAVFAVTTGYLSDETLRLSNSKWDTGEAGVKQGVMLIDTANEAIRVSDRVKLAEVTAFMREKINMHHMKKGVTIIDPTRTDICADVTIGSDTIIYPGCFLENGTKIGENCVIGPDTRIYGSEIADGVCAGYSVILDSKIGRETTIGPFAYIRPHSVIGEKCKIGDFVEVKNSVIGDETKASHLTYIGDSEVGQRVNFGCGTVTVNYDGTNKHKTIIKDNAFIGCNTNLVAPVEIGENAYTAAGSTIAKNVEPDSLAIARSYQVNKPGWVAKRNS